MGTAKACLTSASAAIILTAVPCSGFPPHLVRADEAVQTNNSDVSTETTESDVSAETTEPDVSVETAEPDVSEEAAQKNNADNTDNVDVSASVGRDYGSSIQVVHSDGIREIIRDGHYQLMDSKDRVIVTRRATRADLNRLRKGLGKH